MAGMAGDGDVLRALAGGAWARKCKWPSQGPPTTAWDGVKKVVHGRVTKLWLEEKGLTGSIPHELGQLQKLEFLWLEDNQLTGSIPSELGQLRNLTELSLASNQLTGEIPKELGDLANLKGLDLGRNRLTGSIPSELGQLQQLGELWLAGNQLTGSIPSQLGNLRNLEKLLLWDNQLTGSIPPELGILTNLKELILSTNQLTGSIPPELGQLQSLQWLYLHENKLTGAVPYQLDQLTKLKGFHCDSSLDGAPADHLESREVVQQWQLTLADRRQAEAEALRLAAEGSPFFKQLKTYRESDHIVLLLDRLYPLISCAPELQLYITLTCAARRNNMIEDSHRNSYVLRALETSVGQVPTSSANIAVFKLALDKAEELGAITRGQKYALDNRAELKRMEHAPFVKNMQECIWTNAVAIRGMGVWVEHLGRQVDAHGAAIQGIGVYVDHLGRRVSADGAALHELGGYVDHLGRRVNAQGAAIQGIGKYVDHLGRRVNAHGAVIENLGRQVDAQGAAIDHLGRRVDAHEQAIIATHHALMDFRAAYQKKLKYESTVGVLKMVINAFSFGIGGSLVDVGLAAFMDGVIDFSDVDVVRRCLQVPRIAGFNPVAVLQADQGTAFEKEQLFGAMDAYASYKGDEALDAATRGHVAIKLLAVAAASCNDTVAAALCNDNVVTRRELQSAASSQPPLPPPAPTAPGDIAEALARARLGHLEGQLGKAGFTTLEALKELAEFGKEEFLSVAKEDVGVQKIGERLGLWSLAKAL